MRLVYKQLSFSRYMPIMMRASVSHQEIGRPWKQIYFPSFPHSGNRKARPRCRVAAGRRRGRAVGGRMAVAVGRRLGRHVGGRRGVGGAAPSGDGWRRLLGCVGLGRGPPSCRAAWGYRRKRPHAAAPWRHVPPRPHTDLRLCYCNGTFALQASRELPPRGQALSRRWRARSGLGPGRRSQGLGAKP